MNPQDMDIDSFDQWHLPENALHEGHAVIGYANAAVVTLPLAESNPYHPEISWNNKRWLATISVDDDPKRDSLEERKSPLSKVLEGKKMTGKKWGETQDLLPFIFLPLQASNEYTFLAAEILSSQAATIDDMLHPT